MGRKGLAVGCSAARLGAAGGAGVGEEELVEEEVVERAGDVGGWVRCAPPCSAAGLGAAGGACTEDDEIVEDDDVGLAGGGGAGGWLAMAQGGGGGWVGARAPKSAREPDGVTCCARERTR